MPFFFSVLSFLQIERERERERVVYKIWVSRRNSPKVTYLIFRRGSPEESFFFHRLINFMLFLILARRTRVPRVSDILLSSTRNTGFDSSARYEPCQTTAFFSFSISADGKESPFPFWGPSQSLGFSLPPSWSADFLGLLDVTQVRLLSTNICWSSLRPTFFLNGLPLFIPTGG